MNMAANNKMQMVLNS